MVRLTQFGFATGLVCLQFVVRQSFALDIQYPTLKLVLSVHPSNIVTTHELGNVAMQMLGADLVVRAIVATLHQSPELLNCIPVSHVSDELSDRVFDRPVVVLLVGSYPFVRPVLICIDSRSLLHVLAHLALQWLLIGAPNVLCMKLAVTFLDSDNGILALGSASSFEFL